jgi:hypothetical protein
MEELEKLQRKCNNHNSNRPNDYAFVAPKDLGQLSDFLAKWKNSYLQKEATKEQLKDGSYLRDYPTKNIELGACLLDELAMMNHLSGYPNHIQWL